MKELIRDMARQMAAAVPEAHFEVRFWDGDSVRIGDAEPAFVMTFNTRASLSRVIADAFMGFGEGYMVGDIDFEGEFQHLFRLAFAIDFLERPVSTGLKLRMALRHVQYRNTVRGSARNIRVHYDVGNDFYEMLLGPSMAYTCAYYRSDQDTLDQAQVNKYEHVCRKLLLQPGDHMADLGCGWGGLLIHAAEHFGATGVGVTVSPSQQEWATAKIAERGLSDRIEIRLQDFRNLTGSFDKLASVGLLEHLGHSVIPTAFAKAKEVLRPGGLALFHTISTDLPGPPDPWIEKYVFPGTVASPLTTMVNAAGKHNMFVQDVENLRIHYVRTAQAWLANMEANAAWVRDTYDEQFLRRYRLYLEVGTAGFAWGNNRLFQILVTNGLNNDLPLTRDHLSST